MVRELIAGLNKETTRVILASSAVLVLWSLFSSVWRIGPVTASIITYSLYMFYWFYAIKYKNPLLIRLLILGTVAGILELATDHYLVDTINSLVYPNKELMIWSSPAYMPLAWSNVLLQLGFIGVLLTRKFGIAKASILLGIAGGMYIPLYEHLANNAGWWWYNTNVLMVFNAPVYVIICEALISFSLPWLIQHAENHSLKKTFLLGTACGVWIYISANLAFILAG